MINDVEQIVAFFWVWKCLILMIPICFPTVDIKMFL